MILLTPKVLQQYVGVQNVAWYVTAYQEEVLQWPVLRIVGWNMNKLEISAPRRGQQRLLHRTSLFCGVYTAHGADTAYYVQVVLSLYHVTEQINTVHMFFCYSELSVKYSYN